MPSGTRRRDDPPKPAPASSNPALGIMCKAPRSGRSKTRLGRLIGPEHAASLSRCFLADVAGAIAAVTRTRGGRGYGIYAPAGAEDELMAILPADFGLVLQENADFGVALREGARRLLALGHGCALLINSDSPTLPPALLEAAVDALGREGERVVLGPAIDGGYTLIGVKADHPVLFEGIPWSTPEVLRTTLERARGANLAVDILPTWYDVDDAETFGLLLDEVAGRRPAFAAAGLSPAPASATRAYLAASGLSR